MYLGRTAGSSLLSAYVLNLNLHPAQELIWYNFAVLIFHMHLSYALCTRHEYAVH